jgi:hypothetical protein
MGIDGVDIDEDVATAFGIFALTETTLPEAAKLGGVTRWELEDAIENAGLSETFDIDSEGDVSETIDDLLDG